MNGARTIFRRKGYLLTALIAAVLLAASSGTALAQVEGIMVRSVTVDAADSAGVVAEGTTTNVTVTLNKAVPVGETVTAAITKTYTAAGVGGVGNAEAVDIVMGGQVLIPGGSSYGQTPVIFGLDTDAVDERFMITVASGGLSITTNVTPNSTIDDTNLPVSTPSTGKIDDAQEQTYTLTADDVPSQITETATFSFTALASPARPAGEPVTVYLAATPGYAITGDDVMAAGAGLPAFVTLTDEATAGREITLGLTGGNDKNRIDDVVTLTAHLGNAVRGTQVAMAEVTVLDAQMLPASDAITADALDNVRRDLGMAVESVTEGDTAYVWVAVINTATDRVLDTENFTVAVTGANPAQALDYKITAPSSTRITTGSARGTARVGPWVVEVLADEDVGMEELMLSLDVTGDPTYGPGTSSGTLSIGIEDNTEKKVWPLPEAEAYPAITDAMDAAAGDDGLNPGETFTVMTSDLFGLAEGYTAAYAASVEGGAVSVSASGDSVTVNAVSAGESKVTVTATAKMASSSFAPEQTVSNVASITFAVEVVDIVEPPVEPESMNTIEPKSEDEAYPVITGAIEMGAGDEGLNPGESFSVMASALFTVMDGYTASYSASVDGSAASASVSGDSVTVMADMAGEAKVTVIGTAKMASSSFAPEQVATNVAEITFAVMVVDKALVVMLEMPANVMDGNIVEGESYDIMVSANRMITAAEGSVEVMIMRDRAASDAGEEDFTVSSATIMAGYDSATAELMVTEDMMPDGGTDDNMGESLVLYGMAGDMATNSLTFTIWDQAVPSLPLIGQLLLALFLMLGGARLYRRRQG